MPIFSLANIGPAQGRGERLAIGPRRAMKGGNDMGMDRVMGAEWVIIIGIIAFFFWQTVTR